MVMAGDNEPVEVGGVSFSIGVNLSSFERSLAEAEQIARTHVNRIQQSFSQLSVPRASTGQAPGIPTAAPAQRSNAAQTFDVSTLNSLRESIDALHREQTNLAAALRETVAALRGQSLASTPMSMPSMGSGSPPPPAADGFRLARVDTESGQPAYISRRLTQPAINQRQLPVSVTGGMSPYAGAPFQPVAPPPVQSLPPALVTTPSSRASYEHQSTYSIADQLHLRDDDVARRIPDSVEAIFQQAVRRRRARTPKTIGTQLPLFEGLAQGGSAQPGRHYLGGEHGPELFVPAGQESLLHDSIGLANLQPAHLQFARSIHLAEPRELQQKLLELSQLQYQQTGQRPTVPPYFGFRGFTADNKDIYLNRQLHEAGGASSLAQTLAHEVGHTIHANVSEHFSAALNKIRHATELGFAIRGSGGHIIAAPEQLPTQAAGKNLHEDFAESFRLSLSGGRGFDWHRLQNTQLGEQRASLMHAVRQSIEHRRSGGSTQGRRAYIIGERGPELFVPQQAGYVFPHHSPQTQAFLHRADGGPVDPGGASMAEQYVHSHPGAPEFALRRDIMAQFGLSSSEADELLVRLGVPGAKLRTPISPASETQPSPAITPTLRRQVRRAAKSQIRGPREPRQPRAAPSTSGETSEYVVQALSEAEVLELTADTALGGEELPEPVTEATAAPAPRSRKQRKQTAPVGDVRQKLAAELQQQRKLIAVTTAFPVERIPGGEEERARILGIQLDQQQQLRQQARQLPRPSRTTPEVPASPIVQTNEEITRRQSELTNKNARPPESTEPTAARPPRTRRATTVDVSGLTAETEAIQRKLPLLEQLTAAERAFAEASRDAASASRQSAGALQQESAAIRTKTGTINQETRQPRSRTRRESEVATHTGPIAGPPGRMPLALPAPRVYPPGAFVIGSSPAAQQLIVPGAPRPPGQQLIIPGAPQQQAPLQGIFNPAGGIGPQGYGPSPFTITGGIGSGAYGPSRATPEELARFRTNETIARMRRGAAASALYRRIPDEFPTASATLAGIIQPRPLPRPLLSSVFSQDQPNRIQRFLGAQTPAQSFVSQVGQENAARLQEAGLSQKAAEHFGREAAAKQLLTERTSQLAKALAQGRGSRTPNKEEETTAQVAARQQLHRAGVDTGSSGDGGGGGGGGGNRLFGFSPTQLARITAGLIGVNIGINVAAGVARQFHDIIAGSADEALHLASASRAVSAEWGASADVVKQGFATFQNAPLAVGTRADFEQAAASLAPLAQQYNLTGTQATQLTTITAQLATVQGRDLTQSMQLAQDVMRGNSQAAQLLGVNLVDQYGALRTTGLTWQEMSAAMGPAAASQQVLSAYIKEANAQLDEQANSSNALARSTVGLNKAWADFQTTIGQSAASPLVPIQREVTSLLRDVTGLFDPSGNQIKAAGRQAGGDVGGKRAYIVGEKGPELFVPNQAGYVFPHNSSQTQQALHRAEGGSVDDRLDSSPSQVVAVPQQSPVDTGVLQSDFIKNKAGGSIGRTLIGAGAAAGLIGLTLATGGLDLGLLGGAGLLAAGTAGGGAAGLFAPDIGKFVGTGIQQGLTAENQAATIQAYQDEVNASNDLKNAMDGNVPILSGLVQGIAQVTGGTEHFKDNLDKLQASMEEGARIAQEQSDHPAADAIVPPPPRIPDRQERRDRVSDSAQQLLNRAAATEGYRLQQSRAQLSAQEAQARVSGINAQFEINRLGHQEELNRLTSQSIDIENQRAPLLLQQQAVQDQINIRTQENLQLVQTVLEARRAEVPAAAGLEQVSFTQRQAQLRAQVSIADTIRGRAPTFDIGAQIGTLFTSALSRPAAELADLEAQHTVNQAQFAQTVDQLTKDISVIPLREWAQGLERNLDLLNEEQSATQSNIEWINRGIELAKVQGDAAAAMINASIDVANATIAEADAAQKLAAAALNAPGGPGIGGGIGSLAIEVNLFNPPAIPNQDYLNQIAATIQSNTIDAINTAMRTAPSRLPTQTSGARGSGPFGAS